jgi:hypothetical protein
LVSQQSLRGNQWRGVAGDDVVLRATAGDSPVGAGAAWLAVVLDDQRRQHARPLTVWCAGAGGLAEPLTVALLAHASACDVDIVATDIAPAALRDIRHGAIAGSRLRLPRSIINGRLTADDDGHRPVRAIADSIRCAQGDVRDVPGGQPFDVVICRDVLHHYQPAVARTMLDVLIGACGAQGLVVISGVDALAAGWPLSGSGAVFLRGGTGEVVALDIDAFTDGDAHAVLRLAALTDDTVEIRRRQSRLLTFTGHAEAVAEARLVAAALAVAAGQLEHAESLLNGAVPPLLESDRSTLSAAVAVLHGRPQEARVRLAQASTSSWLAPFVMGQVLQRLHRPLDAQPFFRVASKRLDGPGSAPVAVAFLPSCGPDEARAICAGALRRVGAWHGL